MLGGHEMPKLCTLCMMNDALRVHLTIDANQATEHCQEVLDLRCGSFQVISQSPFCWPRCQGDDLTVL